MSTARKPVTGRTRAIVLFLDRSILWLTNHWLALFNVLDGIYVGLAVLAPLLAAWGLSWPAQAIFFGYQYLCHQRPERSFFIFGRQMAFCQRDTAIYGAVLAAGLLYAATGRRWRPLSWWGAMLLLLPAAADGSIQLLTVYESGWFLRTTTGLLAGVAAVWFLYPRVDHAFHDVRMQVLAQLERAALRDRGLLKDGLTGPVPDKGG